MTENDFALIPPSKEGGLNFIEQLAARSVVRCPNSHAPILRATNPRLRIMHYVKASCGMWSCPVCSTKNSQKWIARIIEGYNRNKKFDWVFCTITAHEKTRGKSSLWNLRQGWPKLLRRYKRATESNPLYVMVYEPHADDENSLHMHMIMNYSLGKKWWKDNARECGMGYQDHERPLTNAGQAAGYCAKYLLKAADNADRYEKNMRRINCSRNWPELRQLSEDQDEYEWTFVKGLEDMRWQAQFFHNQGWNVTGYKQVEAQIKADSNGTFDGLRK